MKFEYTPKLNLSYTAPNSAQKIEKNRWKNAFLRIFFCLSADVDDVTDAPFLDAAAACRRVIDDLSVENHGR